MATGTPSHNSCLYQDFDPSSELRQEQEFDTLVVKLPGFSSEQISVHIDGAVLKISGECPLGFNKWNRFLKEFPVPANCSTDKLCAKFYEEVLEIEMPKLITADGVNKSESVIQAVRRTFENYMMKFRESKHLMIANMAVAAVVVLALVGHVTYTVVRSHLQS